MGTTIQFKRPDGQKLPGIALSRSSPGTWPDEVCAQAGAAKAAELLK
jgi:hypothetical protein